jgi:hypothetical protein
MQKKILRRKDGVFQADNQSQRAIDQKLSSFFQSELA